MAPSVVDDDQQVIDFVWCGSATNASDTLSNSDDSTDDPSCSEAWEEAKNLLPVLQLKLDREDKFVGRFSRVPLSELPILFKVSEKILCSGTASQTTISPLLALPQEVQDMIVDLLDPADAACLVSTCKQLGRITHTLAIQNSREYFIRREYLEYGTDMCGGCHKRRPTTEDFWSTDKGKGIITEWLDPFIMHDIELGHGCRMDLVEQYIKEWVVRPLASDEESTDPMKSSVKNLVIASNKREFIKCPTCNAQDCYDLRRLEDELADSSILRETCFKIIELAIEATDL